MSGFQVAGPVGGDSGPVNRIRWPRIHDFPKQNAGDRGLLPAPRAQHVTRPRLARSSVRFDGSALMISPSKTPRPVTVFSAQRAPQSVTRPRLASSLSQTPGVPAVADLRHRTVTAGSDNDSRDPPGTAPSVRVWAGHYHDSIRFIADGHAAGPGGTRRPQTAIMTSRSPSQVIVSPGLSWARSRCCRGAAAARAADAVGTAAQAAAAPGRRRSVAAAA